MRRALSCALVLVALGATGCSTNESPGTGEKIGQIVKLSKQGLLCKTWEGQIIRGGMSGGSGAFGTVPFDFTIESDEMAQKATEYMQNQTEVLINYRMELVYALCRSDSSGHFVTSIEPAPKEPTFK